jgi:hypothetical protein
MTSVIEYNLTSKIWYLLRLSRHDDISDITAGSSIDAKAFSDGKRTSDVKRTESISFQAKFME